MTDNISASRPAETPYRPLFRPAQHAILNYRGGKVGVSAVPGSGKTFTLANLAARLVERLVERDLADEQEVLVVTFSNSAVNSLKARIGQIVQTQRGLLPYIGYRVRTLHGLAHDIVRERPSLVGLAEDFKIVDERVGTAILRETVDAWLRASDDRLMAFIDTEEMGEGRAKWLRNEKLPEVALSMAGAFIKQAKDRQLSPDDLRARLDSAEGDLRLAQFGVEVYEAYQRGLAYRGAVDFDDLVRLALQALAIDPDFLKRLQKRWPYILEDEAQDSSLLQEKMLRLLSNDHNWVRVGDPNQAINTTFTTANPRYLRDFLRESGVQPHTLAEAGRSARPILDLANELMRWTVHDHPVEELRAAFHEQDIRTTPPGDMQPNPSPAESTIHIHYEPGKEISPEEELKQVVRSLENWLPKHPDRTVAVLVPENSRGFKLSEILRARGLEYEELLRSTTATRDAAQALRLALVYLASPTDYSALARLYRDVWWPDHLGRASDIEPEDLTKLRDQASEALTQNKTTESFLWPGPGLTPLKALPLGADADSPDLRADLEAFRARVVRWLEAATLPVDQLILTIGQDLFGEPSDIALGYKIAQLLRAATLNYPDWRLPQFAEELRAISDNERRFLGFDDADRGYEPTRGRVTVSTMHAAKGLEWDRVYLLAVSNYGFPSAQGYDNYIGERYFVRDRLNLEAEILAQLEALTDGKACYEGEATMQARLDYAAERLRLLYVGITRARRELSIWWNTGRYSGQGNLPANQPSLPLVTLWNYLNPRGTDNAGQ